MFIRSTGEPVVPQVVGHSEHGFAYHRITYEQDAPDSARDADGGAESDVSSLTSAKELPDASTTDEDSDLNSDTEVLWVKSARGVLGMRQEFWEQVVFCKGHSRREMGSQKSACACQASY